MIRARIAVALSVALLVTASAFAQEFGRDFGGEIEATMKRPNMLSGSLGLSLTRSTQPFGTLGNGRSYDGTFGGTIVKDRMWFFGTAQMQQQPTGFVTATPGTPTIALGTMTAAMSNRNQALTTSFDRTANFASVPSSFMSLHYTGIISSNSFFTASVTRHTSSQPNLVFLPPQ